MLSFLGLDFLAPAAPPIRGFGADLIDYSMAGLPSDAYGYDCDAARASEGFGADKGKKGGGLPADPAWSNQDAIKAYAIALWGYASKQAHAKDTHPIAVQLRALKASSPSEMLSAVIEYGPPLTSAGAQLYYSQLAAAVAKATAAGLQGIRLAPARMTEFLAQTRKGTPKKQAAAVASAQAQQAAQAVKPGAVQSAAAAAVAITQAAAGVANNYIDTAGRTIQAAAGAPGAALAEADRSIDQAIQNVTSIPEHYIEAAAATIPKVAESWAEGAGKAAFGFASGGTLVAGALGLTVGGIFFAPEIAAAWKAKGSRK